MPDDVLKIGDRVRLSSDAADYELFPDATGIVIWTETILGVETLTVRLDYKDGFAMRRPAEEWERVE